MAGLQASPNEDQPSDHGHELHHSNSGLLWALHDCSWDRIECLPLLHPRCIDRSAFVSFLPIHHGQAGKEAHLHLHPHSNWHHLHSCWICHQQDVPDLSCPGWKICWHGGFCLGLPVCYWAVPDKDPQLCPWPMFNGCPFWRYGITPSRSLPSCSDLQASSHDFDGHLCPFWWPHYYVAPWKPWKPHHTDSPGCWKPTKDGQAFLCFLVRQRSQRPPGQIEWRRGV